MGKLTQVFQQCLAWEQETVGELTEADVWQELREATLGDRSVLVIGLYSTHKPDKGDLFEDTRKEYIEDKFHQGICGTGRLAFWIPPEVTKEIEVPAQRHYEHVSENLGTGVVTTDIYAFQGSRTMTRKEQRRFTLRNKRNVAALKGVIEGRYNNLLEWWLSTPKDNHSPIGTVVIFEPDDGDLECLPDFRNACPDVNIVIFHTWGDKWGVEVESDDNPDAMWDTQSQVENEPDLPWVIELIAHMGESTWFGALPKQGKTWVMLCVVKALLTGEPLFGDPRLKVTPSNRVIKQWLTSQ